MGQLAGLLHLAAEVLLERHEGVLRAVVDVAELHLADGRTDRRDVQAVLVLQVANLLDFAQRQVHHVLDAVADVDESQAVVLQPQGGEGGKLLHGRLLVGGFVGKPRQDHSWQFRHEG